VIAAVPIALLALASPAPSEEPYAPGRVIVRFEAGTSAVERRASRVRANASLERRLLLPRTQVLEVEGSVRAAAASLERLPQVEFAEPDYVVESAATPTNDPRFAELWGVRNTGQSVNGVAGTAGVDVNALPAWDSSRGAGRVIAIVDSGVASDHPDLLGVAGHDFVDSDANPDAGHWHGTHSASVAAALGDNGIGTVGVAPRASIMPVRVLDDAGLGLSSRTADGIVYAARQGADVINLSLGSAGGADVFTAALDEARAHDAVVVSAATNGNGDIDQNPHYPCALAHANNVCVAAIDQDASLSSFSSYGATSVDIGAPGRNVLGGFPAFDELVDDDFEGSLANWETGGTGDSWTRTNAASHSPSKAVEDSPGGNYLDGTDSFVRMAPAAAVDLTGRRNCGLRYFLRADVAAGDEFHSGLLGAGGFEETSAASGSTGGRFNQAHIEVPGIAGNPAARAIFRLQTDASTTADGVYVDDVQIGCRGGGYEDSDYRFVFGTSVAVPHVAGVAALVRATAPHLNADQVVQAIKAGAVPLATLAGKTSTGGRVDAAGALAAAPPPPPEAGDGAAVDRSAPSARLAGRRRQRLRRAVVVVVVCSGSEDCVVDASGSLGVPGGAKVFRLRGVRGKQVAAGRRARVALRVRRGARRAARRALRRGKRVRARIQVVVGDAAGNRRTLSHRIRLVGRGRARA
jgi:thermitase